MTTYVLYNGKSGNGKGGQNAQKVRTLCKGRDLTFRDVLEISDYSAFFKELGADDDIILCGGDGTLNHFINDIDGLELKNDVYFYPTGTGNDFWKDMGKTAEDGPALINRYLKDLPTVTVKGKKSKFINGIGYGIDGYCCEEGDKLRVAGQKDINYTSIAIKGLLFKYKPTNAKVTVDGKEYSFERVWLAPTMKGRFYGGGMMPTPDQNRFSENHEVSVMVMFGAGKVKTLAAFPTIFKGEHVKKEKIVKVMKGKNVNVKFDRPVALQIDGETVLNVTEYSVEA